MAQKKRVGVIFGGRSGEHEVSLVSARSVIRALSSDQYDIIQIGIAKNGACIVHNNPLKRLSHATPETEFRSEAVIMPEPDHPGIAILSGNTHKDIDVFFPLIHGSYGEDGTLQGLLELANKPYVGSNVLGAAVAMDKVIQKQICQQNNIPVVSYVAVHTADTDKQRQQALRQAELIGYPLFIKPANLGSSVGITKAHTNDEMIAGIQLATRYDHKTIIEQGIEPVHEIEIAVLGNERPRASVPGEIVASNEFYDYDAKYVDGKSTHVIPAQLPEDVLSSLQAMAIKAFQVCNCNGMARVDFLVHQKTYASYCNEINTIPGFTSISMYAKLWEASGLPYRKLLQKLIKLGIIRHQNNQNLIHTYLPKNNWHQQ